MDYDFEHTSVTFPPGVTIVQFNVTIIDDDVLEGNEYLMLQISGSTVGVLFGLPHYSLIIILDDDFITGINSKLLVVSYTYLNTHYSNVNSLYNNVHG